MTDVFLSYSRVDAERAALIHGKLTALGLTVFFDVSDDHGIAPSASFPQRIGEAVQASKAVLALWTPTALKSEWCRRECGLARALNKLIPAALSHLSVEDTREFYDASYLSLIDFIGQEQHADWARVLHAIAERMTGWLDANPTATDYNEVSARAAGVRRAAALARSPFATIVAAGQSLAAEAWARIDRNNMGEVAAIPISFPGSPEAFEAAMLIQRNKAQDNNNRDHRKEAIIAEYLVNARSFWRVADWRLLLLVLIVGIAILHSSAVFISDVRTIHRINTEFSSDYIAGAPEILSLLFSCLAAAALSFFFLVRSRLVFLLWIMLSVAYLGVMIINVFPVLNTPILVWPIILGWIGIVWWTWKRFPLGWASYIRKQQQLDEEWASLGGSEKEMATKISKARRLKSNVRAGSATP